MGMLTNSAQPLRRCNHYLLNMADGQVTRELEMRSSMVSDKALISLKKGRGIATAQV
jgi:hypothetical protein